LRAEPPALDGVGAFRVELLPVDYRRIGERLAEIGRVFAPDIAVHFGLAANARGFRLERVGRNSFAGARPDNSGFCPADGPICAGAPTLVSTLPLGEIFDALKDAGLPVEWSDDAGDYLCNMAMTLSLAGGCEGFAPAVAGFIHVPLVGEGLLGADDLHRGTEIILAATLRARLSRDKHAP